MCRSLHPAGSGVKLRAINKAKPWWSVHTEPKALPTPGAYALEWAAWSEWDLCVNFYTYTK